MTAVLHFVADDADPWALTARDIVPPYPGAEPAITHIGLWGAEALELADSDGSHWWFGGVARRT